MKTLIIFILCIVALTSNAQFKANPWTTNTYLDTPMTAVNVRSYGALGNGSTDDTSAFYAALATGKAVYVPISTNAYLIRNLILTNGNTLFSYGARLGSPAGSSNWMIMVGNPTTVSGGTNPQPQNIKIFGFDMDGGSGTNISATVSNRHGIWFDPYGYGNLAHDLYIHSFNGIGFLSQAHRPDTLKPDDQMQGHWYSITARTNAVGIKVATGSPPLPFVDAGTFDGEYQHAVDLNASWNQIGFWLQSGNCNFSGCDLSRNGQNMVAYGVGGSTGHGSMVNSSINHSQFGAASAAGIVFTNIMNGYLFDNCNIWFSPVYLTNCMGIVVQNGEYNSGGFVSVGGNGNQLRNNVIPSSSFPLVVISSSPGSAAYNNVNTNGVVDSIPGILGGIGGLFSTNNINLTSGALQWPPTYVSLGASSTNQVWQYPSNSIPPNWWFGHFNASSNVVFDGHMP